MLVIICQYATRKLSFGGGFWGMSVIKTYDSCVVVVMECEIVSNPMRDLFGLFYLSSFNLVPIPVVFDIRGAAKVK